MLLKRIKVFNVAEMKNVLNFERTYQLTTLRSSAMLTFSITKVDAVTCKVEVNLMNQPFYICHGLVFMN